MTAFLTSAVLRHSLTDQPCSLVFFGIRRSGGSRQPRWWWWQQLSHLTSRCWLCVLLHVSHLPMSINAINQSLA